MIKQKLRKLRKLIDFTDDKPLSLRSLLLRISQAIAQKHLKDHEDLQGNTDEDLQGNTDED